MGRKGICLFIHMHCYPSSPFGDIGVDTFLLALQRFAGRRGLPATIISGNAKTFESSSKQVTKIMRSSEVQGFLTSKRIL